MHFAKLFSTITDSSIWSEDHATRIVWVTLIAMADARGEVHAAVPGLARRAVVTLAECEQALAKFLAPDIHSRSPEHEGRRLEPIQGGWRLLNHGRYQGLLSDEAARARKREWWRKNRGKKATPEKPRQTRRLDPGKLDANSTYIDAEVDAEVDADPASTTVLTDTPQTPSPALGSSHLPESWSEVMARPIADRARWIAENPHRAIAYEPHRWPEVLEPLRALAAADGQAPPRPGAYQRDKAVQLLLDHYTTGWTQAELVAMYGSIPSSTWWLGLKASGKRPGASWLSPEVLRRHEGALGTENATTAALELARRQVQNEKRNEVAKLVAGVEYTNSLRDADDEGWGAGAVELPSGPTHRRLTQ